MDTETYLKRYVPKISAISEKMTAIGNKKDSEWKRLRKQWLVYTKRVLERIQEEDGDTQSSFRHVLTALAQETKPTQRFNLIISECSRRFPELRTTLLASHAPK